MTAGLVLINLLIVPKVSVNQGHLPKSIAKIPARVTKIAKTAKAKCLFVCLGLASHLLPSVLLPAKIRAIVLPAKVAKHRVLLGFVKIPRLVLRNVTRMSNASPVSLGEHPASKAHAKSHPLNAHSSATTTKIVSLVFRTKRLVSTVTVRKRNSVHKPVLRMRTVQSARMAGRHV